MLAFHFTLWTKWKTKSIIIKNKKVILIIKKYYSFNY
jgi:hypothetical protein